VGTERVLIAGGGIAGLSLDLALRGGPWQVELVEREAGPARPGAGLAVQPNAMRALHGLGVAAAVERVGAVIHRFQYRDQHGTLLCDIDLDDLWGPVGPFVGITRAALHDALLPDPGRCRTGRSAWGLRPRRRSRRHQLRRAPLRRQPVTAGLRRPDGMAQHRTHASRRAPGRAVLARL